MDQPFPENFNIFRINLSYEFPHKIVQMRSEYVVGHDSYPQLPRPLLGMPGTIILFGGAHKEKTCISESYC